MLIAPVARRQLTELPRAQLERVDDRILALAEDPRPAGAKHLDRDLWRVRAGDFHVAHAGGTHPDLFSSSGALVMLRSELHRSQSPR